MKVKTAKAILRTKLCDFLEIEYPIILAGMYGVSGPELAAAVSNAGGMGVLGATMLSAEEVRSWIRKTKSLTNKPFGVDLLVGAMPEAGTRETFKVEFPPEHVSFINRMKEELRIPDVKAPPIWERLTMEEVKCTSVLSWMSLPRQCMVKSPGRKQSERH